MTDLPPRHPPCVVLHAALQVDEICRKLLKRETEREHRLDFVGGQRQRQAFAADRLDDHRIGDSAAS